MTKWLMRLMNWVSIKISIIGLFLIGCVSSQHTRHDEFPDIWWKPLAHDQMASWEIPPQAADRSKNEVILSKRNELGQFSNLQEAAFELDGDKYSSLEGLWQSLKYPENSNDERLRNSSVVWPFTREQVKKLSGFEAKKAGDLASENMKKLGVNWVTYQGQKIDYTGADNAAHYDLILRASRAKLAAHPHLIKLLKSTKDLKFLPDHKQKPDAPASYKYHEIYMKLRAELKIDH